AKIPFRVDFDDRDMSVGKKIRESGRHWVPYTIVIGDREVSGDELAVRIHGGEQRQFSIDQLNETIRQEIAGRPYRPLNVSVRLSERPIFVG
ncbi:MAG: threonine--tRNA ligase, partial [Candidatus Eisenbacteria sp.]|nr:threonine--tRNA ligase [Candidatus Eisenbacteria bacterium]